MRNTFFSDNNLTPLNENEIIDIQGGGLIYDFFYPVAHAAGAAARKVVEFFTPENDDANNPAKLNSGTYYGR